MSCSCIKNSFYNADFLSVFLPGSLSVCLYVCMFLKNFVYLFFSLFPDLSITSPPLTVCPCFSHIHLFHPSNFFCKFCSGWDGDRMNNEQIHLRTVFIQLDEYYRKPAVSSTQILPRQSSKIV